MEKVGITLTINYSKDSFTQLYLGKVDKGDWVQCAENLHYELNVNFDISTLRHYERLIEGCGEFDIEIYAPQLVELELDPTDYQEVEKQLNRATAEVLSECPSFVYEPE